MSDIIEKIGNSLIQHGTYNNRIYLMKLDTGDLPDIIPEMDQLAEKHGYSKIFAKVPADSRAAFDAKGYVKEAGVPGYYSGKKDALFMCKYFSEHRQEDTQAEDDRIISTARGKAGDIMKPELPESFLIRICTEADVPAMAEIYAKVFPTYPFPIQDPAYLKETMEDNVVYFAVENEGDIVALSSSEIDFENWNAEMTDFATLPQFRGMGLSTYLLSKMETEMNKKGILTLYTIARAASYGMNTVFARLGYEFTGKLVQNTNISGNLENMNVWYKRL
ncbi:putative beta-lysine N-acetyltransferase [Methanohalophilus halophilus]|uniref:Putative beta-lysine N-acetyltransferase n=1 Tax=Methanohalophilus halophilus TaxID=2177 RepID=A0A1L3Q2Q8_9EURY|nr:putative beta-lysine N-acetyltransferase [Methanohalophilus halophilus]APH39164.1 putative beta-lysine N-acetyltransferase [Methanohalophilus halophilus]RNI09778.1 putative beta-lysine N-acetyltransferase [Methanohalophilus halophilus]SDW56743.1 putative beta-lysine N-acetyltransferase [Methanohalophilus halophilus]